MSCNIELINYHGAYLAGSTITGKVVCNFHDPQDIRGIKLKLKGFEKVQWKRGKNNYLKKDTFLMEHTILAPAGRLGPGRFEYPYSLTLPQNIPTSFTGKYGWITYSLKANVDIPFHFDYKNKVRLNIIFPLDLNKIVNLTLLRPSAFEVEKALSCCCIDGGRIFMNVVLEKKAFVPGETIKIHVTILNNSNQSVDHIEARFRIVVKSTIAGWLGDSTIEEKTEVAKTREMGCGAHNERSYEILLKLPTFDAVPNFYNCNLLSYKCDLKVIAGLPCFYKNIIITIPTTLADIPLKKEEDYFRRLNQGAVTAAAIKMMGS